MSGQIIESLSGLAKLVSARIAAESIRSHEIDNAQISVLPDGRFAVLPETWTARVTDLFEGDWIRVYETTADTPVVREFGRHEFAVVDNRYIVDGWILDAGFGDRAVFDLDDPDHSDAIAAIYGPRQAWAEKTNSPSSRLTC